PIHDTHPTTCEAHLQPIAIAEQPRTVERRRQRFAVVRTQVEAVVETGSTPAADLHRPRFFSTVVPPRGQRLIRRGINEAPLVRGPVWSGVRRAGRAMAN